MLLPPQKTHTELYTTLLDLFKAVIPSTDKNKPYEVSTVDWKKMEAALANLHPEKLEQSAIQQHETTSLCTMERFNTAAAASLVAMEARVMEAMAKLEVKIDSQAQGGEAKSGEKVFQAPGEKKKKPEGLEVTIGVRDVSRESTLHTGTELEVKDALEKAMRQAGIDSLKEVSLHEVRRVANDTLILKAHSVEVAKLLREHVGAWQPATGAGLELVRHY